MKPVTKKPNYTKVKGTRGKKYFGLVNNHITSKSFKTATEAEEYTKAVQERYTSLRIAHIRSLAAPLELDSQEMNDAFTVAGEAMANFAEVLQEVKNVS